MADEKETAIYLSHKIALLKLGTRWRDPVPKARPELKAHERDVVVRALEQFVINQSQ